MADGQKRHPYKKIALFMLIFLATGYCISATLNSLRARGVLKDDSEIKSLRSLDTVIELESVLAGLPRGKTIITGSRLKSLIPDHLHRLHYYSPESSITPSRRPNPAFSDYMLVNNDRFIRAAIQGDPVLWEVIRDIRVDGMQNILFLKRGASLESQFESEQSIKICCEMLSKQVKVTVQGGNDFDVDRHETPNCCFAEFLNRTKPANDQLSQWYDIHSINSHIAYHKNKYKVYKGAQKMPVINVSLYGAKAYCAHKGGKLPSYDQWMLSASGGKEIPFPWGEAVDYSNRANLYGADDGYQFWAPVDSFEIGQSPFGVLNMSGNVYEWTEEGFLMGGSWMHGPDIARLTKTDSNSADTMNLHDGFRCVTK